MATVRIPEPKDQWARIINGTTRTYMHTFGKWPAAAKFQLDPDDDFAIPGLDPDVAIAAVNGHLEGNREAALWIVAEATATHLNRYMHAKLRGNAGAIAIATQHIYDELGTVAASPLKWAYLSFPWLEKNSELQG